MAPPFNPGLAPNSTTPDHIFAQPYVRAAYTQTVSTSHSSDNSSRNSGLRYRTNRAASFNLSRSRENDMYRQIRVKGGDSREKVGRLTSVITLSRRSSGATRYSGMLRLGCMDTRSDIRKSPE